MGKKLQEAAEDYQDFWILSNEQVIYQTNTDKDLSHYLSETYQASREGILLGKGLPYRISLYTHIDNGLLTKQLSLKHHRFVVLFAVFIILLGLLVVLFCFRLYNPVRQLRSIILSGSENMGHDGEFHNISLQFQNIRTSWRNAENNLSLVQSNYYKNRLAMTVFYNRYPTSPEEQERLLRALGFLGKEIRCAVIDIIMNQSGINLISDFDDRQKYLMEETVSLLLEDILRKKVNGYCIPRDYLSYVLVLGDDLSREVLEDAFGDISDIFQYDFQYCRIRVGIGSKASCVRDIQKSYLVAETEAYLCDGSYQFQIAFCEDRPITYHANVEKEDFQNIEHIIKAGNVLSLDSLLKGWKKQLYDKQVLVKEQKYFWYEVFRQIYYNIIKEDSLDFYELTGLEMEYFTYGLEAETDKLDDYAEKVCQAANSVCRYYQMNAYNLKDRIGEITSYIQENYALDIGLTEIADHFHSSPHYLSRVFKTEMGVNLSEYIAQLRISIAKRQLVETDEPIGVIAETVGIRSRATFQRLFKRSVGISPSEYRRIYAEKRP